MLGVVSTTHLEDTRLREGHLKLRKAVGSSPDIAKLQVPTSVGSMPTVNGVLEVVVSNIQLSTSV